MCLLVFYIYTVLSGKGFSGSSTDPYCGGTIINEVTILTSVHCFDDQADQFKIKSIQISAGILHFKDAVWLGNEDYFISENGQQQHVKIEKIELHSNSKFDAAIVKLVYPLTFNSYVKPACLPEQYFQPGETAIVSGWGQTNSESEGIGHT